jgi:NADH-quinone oxidoreductase subunit J
MILGPAAQILAFAILSLIAVLGALGMATTMSMFRSGIFLMASFIGVSGLFILLSADLLGLLQMMMYIGGMLVMVLFMVLFMHDPGGSMMAGMKMAPVEKFFSLGLLPEDEDKVEPARVEEVGQEAHAGRKSAHHEHGHQHGDHDMSNSEGYEHGGAGDHNGHSDHGGMDHGAMDHEGMGHSGMNHEGMDHGDMDMSMVTPVRPYAAWLGLTTGALLVGLLLFRPAWPAVTTTPDPDSARRVGDLLMSKYMMAFEGAGLLILVGIFGAVFLARPDHHPSAKGREALVGNDEMPSRLEDDKLEPLVTPPASETQPSEHEGHA